MLISIIWVNFSANAFWVCFSVKLPIFGLFFKFTCLFLENNLGSLCGGQVTIFQCYRCTW